LWQDPNGLTRTSGAGQANLDSSSRQIAGANTLCSAPTAHHRAGMRQYLLRSVRGGHPYHAYQYIVGACVWTRRGIQRLPRIPSIRDKDEFLIPYRHPDDPDFRRARPSRPKAAAQPHRVRMRDGGLFFYVGFTQILALAGRIRYRSAEQYQYILRDESMHCNFASTLSTDKMENPPCDSEFRGDPGLIRKRSSSNCYAEDTIAPACWAQRSDVKDTALHRQSPLPADRRRSDVPGSEQSVSWIAR